MAQNSTIAYTTRGTRFRVDGVDLPGVMSITGLGSGGSEEIIISNLASSSAEYILGLPDEGQVTLDGIEALQHPQMEVIQNARRTGNAVTFEIYVGAVPTGEKITDGSETLVQADVGVASSTNSDGKLVYTTTANANTLKAFGEGDYAVDGNNEDRIDDVERVGGKAVITTASSVAGSATSISIVRPAVKFHAEALVNTFEHSFETNSTPKYSIQLRVTGDLVRTIGTPDLTIT